MGCGSLTLGVPSGDGSWVADQTSRHTMATRVVAVSRFDSSETAVVVMAVGVECLPHALSLWITQPGEAIHRGRSAEQCLRTPSHPTMAGGAAIGRRGSFAC